MSAPVRVRFAPSPTGQPHIGNVRTALFNWLFARGRQGKFIVRIEDTDQTRLVPDAVEGILDGLRWLNIDWDEGPEVGGPYGPYYQSERLDLYQEAARGLMEGGHAYNCYCSPERLQEMRKQQMKEQKTPGYDRCCLNIPAQKLREYKDEGRVPVVRFKMPDPEEITVQDIIRGEVSWRSELLDDFVILKSDGFPTYHLANVLDDHDMEISHVLRAEEWLPSTPRHLMLYRALGLEPPLFGHLPMILGPDRSKLSKRHGATSILEYKEMGYLPEALTNFMALLGWSLDDRTEIMDRRTLVENFSLDRVVKSGAIFNREKLDWMNGVYFRNMSPEELTERILAYWEEVPASQIPRPLDRGYLMRIAPLIQERLKTLRDASGLTSFFFQSELVYEPQELVQKGMDLKTTSAALEQALSTIDSSVTFDAETLEERLRALGSELDLSGRQFFGLLRVATTGSKVSPPLFQTMEVLGRDRCSHRISKAIEALGASSSR